jgi:hypothetical protein
MSFPDYVCAQLGEPSTQRARKRPPPADPVLLATLARLLGELGKIGSNHNQLAYAFNADGDAPDLAAWESAERNIQAMREALMEALGRAG